MTDIFTEIKDELEKSLRENDAGNSMVLVVYLFGSHAGAEAGRDADLDPAFPLDKKAYKLDPLDAVVPAYHGATALGISLGRETDVTILNAASLEMAYEIVTTGRCLFERDAEKRLDYEIALRGMYFDFKPFLDELRSRCISNL